MPELFFGMFWIALWDWRRQELRAEGIITHHMSAVRSFSPLHFLQTHAPRLISDGMRGPVLAALLAFLVGLPCAMLLPPLDRDESRFVQASAQMIESHDYIDINVQKVPRYKKPVGIHWLQVAAVKLTSSVARRDILPYRLPSLFGAALAAFACAWGASRAFGTRTGTKAGLLFAISFMLSTEAFWAKTDAVQCGLITLMMAALAQIYLRTRDLDKDAPRPKMLRLKLVFWLALAGSIMIKIIIGPMVLAASLITLFLWDRKARWARNLSWGWGLILVLAICGPWFVAITVTTDGQFWVGAVGHDFASKLNGGSEGHFMWPGYHTLLLPMTLFPLAWLLGGGLQTAIMRRHEGSHPLCHRLVFCPPSSSSSYRRPNCRTTRCRRLARWPGYAPWAWTCPSRCGRR